MMMAHGKHLFSSENTKLNIAGNATKSGRWQIRVWHLLQALQNAGHKLRLYQPRFTSEGDSVFHMPNNLIQPLAVLRLISSLCE
jgi:hypothetical protein